MTPPVFVSRRAALARTLGCGTLLAGAGCRHDREVRPPDARPTLDSVRAQLVLAPDHAYLNNGTLGPCPGVVLDAMIAALRQLEDNPTYEAYDAMLARADAVRERLAAFVGCDPAELAITSSTTEAMNLIASACELARGDHVLTTDQEHAGGSACWEYLARRRGAQINRVELPIYPKDHIEIMDLIAKAVTPQTRVISVSHVTYTTGLVLPVAELTKLARSKNVLMIVDGAQAAGAIDVDLKSIDADAYAASGHKWLLGPAGTGVLHIRAASRERIAPMPLASGPKVYTGAVGMRDLPAIIGLGAAIDWATSQGKERFARTLAMRNRACEALAKLGYEILSPAAGSPFASLLFTIAVDQPQKVADELLAKHGVVVRVVQHGKVSGLRVSMSAANSDEDVDRLITAMRR